MSNKNSWVGTNVRRGNEYGTVFSDEIKNKWVRTLEFMGDKEVIYADDGLRVLEIRMSDGTEREIALYDLGDINPDELSEWEWLSTHGGTDEWYRFREKL